MKKVLFATTALVASAGIASAQGVELSGSAEMGVVGGDNMETQFHHDIDVKFSLSGETDNGLTFGATIDLDEVNNSAGAFDPTKGGASTGGRDRNLSSVFLSGNFGTITMGDTDGAFDWALQDLDIIADINDSNTAHGGFNGNSRGDGVYDGQVARYDYSFGDFAFAVSLEQDDSPVVGPVVWGIGGKYTAELGGVALGVGLGYQDYGSDAMVGISLDAAMDNGFRAVLNYSDLGDSDGGGVEESHIGVGLFYTMDAISVGVNYGRYEEGANEQAGFGLAANYDLGGGAVVQFGYGDTDSCAVYPGSCTIGNSFSLGVAMSF